MKKILLLLLVTVYIMAGNFVIQKANSSEIIYILEKNGYQIFYNLNKENLQSIFNIKIKNKTLNENELLKILIKNKPIKYTIKNKKIYFYNDYKNNKINKLIFSKNKKIFINFKINKNKDIIQLIQKIDKLHFYNIIYLKLNYYQQNFNLILTKKNYEEILNSLLINKVYGLKKIKNYQDLTDLKKNIKKLDIIINENEKELLFINKNIENLSNYYFPFIKSYVKYNNKNYYYLQNLDYKNNYLHLINGNDFIYLYNNKIFKYFNYKCNIINDLKIKCSNNNYLLEIGK